MGDPFRPTWRRCLLAAVVAAAAFALPQEAPLEWYPLNNPSSGLQYLELTCAANTTGTTRVHYDIGSGFDALHTITIPMGPSAQAFTYTFPLPDAPLCRINLEPLDVPGELRITNCRIIDRAGTEIRRFAMDSCEAESGTATITPTKEGWKFICSPSGTIPTVSLKLQTPIAPRGMNERNLRRCLLSWGYLAGMLWLILLIAWTTLFRPRRWAEMSRTPAFLALLALLFSGVGNRGLIKNSIVAAHFVPPRTAPGYFLELDLNATVDSGTDLFWDTGHGFNSSERTLVFFAPGPIQIARFPLPLANKIVRLRWDPLSRPGAVDVRSIRLVDATGRTALRLPLDSLKPTQQIASVALHDQRLEIHTTPDATDPNLEFAPDTVAAIARVLSPGP